MTTQQKLMMVLTILATVGISQETRTACELYLLKELDLTPAKPINLINGY
jgi:hypothetical protein